MGKSGLLLGVAAALLLPTSLATAVPSAASEDRSDYIVVAEAVPYHKDLAALSRDF